MGDTNYVRFSSSFAMIKMDFLLANSELVIGVIETAVLDTVGGATLEVKCSDVAQ